MLNIENGSDYRLRALTREPLFLVSNDAPGAAENEDRLAALFDKIAGQARREAKHVEVLGRRIPVKRITHKAVWFDFR